LVIASGRVCRPLVCVGPFSPPPPLNLCTFGSGGLSCPNKPICDDRLSNVLPSIPGRHFPAPPPMLASRKLPLFLQNWLSPIPALGYPGHEYVYRMDMNGCPSILPSVEKVLVRTVDSVCQFFSSMASFFCDPFTFLGPMPPRHCVGFRRVVTHLIIRFLCLLPCSARRWFFFHGF